MLQVVGDDISIRDPMTRVDLAVVWVVTLKLKLLDFNFVYWPPIAILYIVHNVTSEMRFLCNKFYYILMSLVKYTLLSDRLVQHAKNALSDSLVLVYFAARQVDSVLHFSFIHVVTACLKGKPKKLVFLLHPAIPM